MQKIVRRRFPYLAGIGFGLSVYCLTPASMAAPVEAGAAIGEATEAQRQRASKLYAEGMEAVKKEDWESALEKFKQSHAAVASPNSLLMVGRSLVELGRVALAYRVLNATVERAEQAMLTDNKYRATADAASKELQDLMQRVGFVKLDVPEGVALTKVTVNGRDVPSDSWQEPIAVDPGKVKVVAADDQGNQDTAEVGLAARETVNVSFDELESGSSEVVVDRRPDDSVTVTESGTTDAPSDARPIPLVSYIAAGVGTAGFATFGVMGWLNADQHSELEDNCPGNVCPADQRGAVDTGRTYQTIANVGLGVGILGFGAAAATYFLWPEDDSNVAVGVGPGFVSVKRRF